LRSVILPIATAVVVALVGWQAVCAGAASEDRRRLWHLLPLLRGTIPTTMDSLATFAMASALGVGLAVVLTYSPLFYPNRARMCLVGGAPMNGPT
jgi:hypothetical protein